MLVHYLKYRKLLEYVDDSYPQLPSLVLTSKVIPYVANIVFSCWEQQDQSILFLFIYSLFDESMYHANDCTTSGVLWHAIEKALGFISWAQPLSLLI